MAPASSAPAAKHPIAIPAMAPVERSEPSLWGKIGTLVAGEMDSDGPVLVAWELVEAGVAAVVGGTAALVAGSDVDGRIELDAGAV